MLMSYFLLLFKKWYVKLHITYLNSYIEYTEHLTHVVSPSEKTSLINLTQLLPLASPHSPTKTVLTQLQPLQLPHSCQLHAKYNAHRAPPQGTDSHLFLCDIEARTHSSSRAVWLFERV